MDPSLTYDLLMILAVIGLVLANGFFVASEFSLVAVRRSRVDELVGEGRANAKALQAAVGKLDAYIAATQLGITMSSLALGWLGEPAIAHLLQPLLDGLPFGISTAAAHVIAVIIAFTLITALHIVLGELAPKTLALQRPEAVSLWCVRPLMLFLAVFRPAILALNWLGNRVVRLAGLKPSEGDEHLHSTEELKLLVTASHQAGLLEPQQQEVLNRVLSMGERRVGDIMTPRPSVEWVDANLPQQQLMRRVRDCAYDTVLLCRGSFEDLVGILRKEDLFDALHDGTTPDVVALARQPLMVHDTATILAVLDSFKRQPVHMAVVIDEYGDLQGIVTQTDLLEAIAGHLPDAEGEEPDFVRRADGSLLIDGLSPVYEAFELLGVKVPDEETDFHTLAGFALARFGRIPAAGDVFNWEGWRFEVMDMDGRRIDKLLVSRRGDGGETAD